MKKKYTRELMLKKREPEKPNKQIKRGEVRTVTTQIYKQYGIKMERRREERERGVLQSNSNGTG